MFIFASEQWAINTFNKHLLSRNGRAVMLCNGLATGIDAAHNHVFFSSYYEIISTCRGQQHAANIQVNVKHRDKFLRVVSLIVCFFWINKIGFVKFLKLNLKCCRKRSDISSLAVLVFSRSIVSCRFFTFLVENMTIWVVVDWTPNRQPFVINQHYCHIVNVQAHTTESHFLPSFFFLCDSNQFDSLISFDRRVCNRFSVRLHNQLITLTRKMWMFFRFTARWLPLMNYYW